MLKLIVGNRNYSSWSLRAGLYLRESGLEYEEIRVPLFTGTWRDELLKYSPAGRVPVLLDGGNAVWDSLAIFETLAERGGIGWPTDPVQRSRARSLACEMHAGFMALRDELPLNLRARTSLPLDTLSSACRAQIDRIEAILEQELGRSGGPWLFGPLSIADIMYAPVVLRFATYGLSTGPASEQFLRQVQSLSSFQQWLELARAEPETLEFIDQRLPAEQSPLTLG